MGSGSIRSIIGDPFRNLLVTRPACYGLSYSDTEINNTVLQKLYDTVIITVPWIQMALAEHNKKGLLKKQKVKVTSYQEVSAE